MVELLSLSWHGRRKKKKDASGGADGNHADVPLSSSTDHGPPTTSPPTTTPSRSTSTTTSNSLSISKESHAHFESLKSFEAERRQKFQTLVDSSKFQLQSHIQLLQEGKDETFRAQRLVLGLIKAHTLLAERGFSTSSNNNTRHDDSAITVPFGMTRGRSREEEDHTGHDSDNDETHTTSRTQDRPSDWLSSLQESNALVFAGIQSKADKLQTMNGKLEKIIKELQDQEEELQQQANTILQLLESSNDKVNQSWDSYQKVAMTRQKDHSNNKPRSRFGDFVLGGSFHGRSSRSLGKHSGHGSKTAANPKSNGQQEGNDTTITNSNNNQQQHDTDVADQWLAEVNYRLALEESDKAITKSLSLISEWLSSTRSYECRRRINLREYLIVVVQTTKEMYQTAESAHTVAVVDWVGKEASEEDIQKQIDQTIREKQAEQQADKGLDKEEQQKEGLTDIPDHGEAADRFSIAAFYESLFATSPLESDYLTRASVVESLVTATDPGRIVLVVVTCDHQLHVFEFDRKNTIDLQETPEAAFAQLVQQGHSVDLSQETGVPEQLRRRRDRLKPKRTIDLSQVDVTESPDMENGIDITSRADATLSYAPLKLKTPSTEEQTELLNALLSAHLQQ